MFHMETDRLRAFCTIVEAGSMTKAAEILGISHSGLSKSISVLQNELGFKIFRPVGRGLEPTERGKDLYLQSRRILELVGTLGTSVAPPEKMVRIGVPEILGMALAGPVAREIAAVSMEELDMGELESRLIERRMEFGLSFVPLPQKDVEHLKVASVVFRSFGRSEAFAGLSGEAIPYAVPATELRDNPLSIKIRDGWNPAVPRLPAYRVNNFMMGLCMARAGACAIYAPVFLMRLLNAQASEDAQLSEIAPPARRLAEQTRRDIFLVKRKSDEESREMKAVLKIIRRVCQN